MYDQASGTIRQTLTNSQRGMIRRQMDKWNDRIGPQMDAHIVLKHGGQRIQVACDPEAGQTARALLIEAAHNAMLACGRTFDFDIDPAE